MYYNNFNQNNYNTVYKPDAKTILDGIINQLHSIVDNDLPSILILEYLDDLVKSGQITYVGKGTNRRVIRINADMRQVLNEKGFSDVNAPVVIKVPFNIFTGSKDNKREQVAWQFMQTIAYNNYTAVDDNTRRAASLLPISQLYEEALGLLLIQEEVIPIERTEAVENIIRTTGMKRGDAVLKMINDNPNLYEQYEFIMSTLDKYLVMVDLNVLFSRFNFGFKAMRNGYGQVEHFITPLDLGYVLPKVIPSLVPVCPDCGKELSYINYTSEFYNKYEDRLNRLQPRMMQYGLYSCKNERCEYNGTEGKRDPFIIDDMKVFQEYEYNVRRFLQENPNYQISANMRKVF